MLTLTQYVLLCGGMAVCGFLGAFIGSAVAQARDENAGRP